MNNSIDINNDHFTLPTPRTSLQNIGEKSDDNEEKRTGRSFHAFGKDGFTFLDFLDVINPLQHIPVVGTVYRSITGDNIDPGSRIAGSGLFGGPIGTALALANVTIEQNTGRDIEGHVLALVTKEDENSERQTNKNSAHSNQFSDIDIASSPITTHAEVLEWAQKETARSAGTVAENHSKDTTHAEKKITSNMEVLNWAQEEFSILHSSIEPTTNSTRAKTRNINQTSINEREEALITSSTLGRNQDQLSGAISPLGGWFSETMLFALARYNESAHLEKSTAEERDVEATDTEY